MAVLYALIPALNEAANLDRLFSDLEVAQGVAAKHGLGLRIVLLDDGSTDGTPDRAVQAAGELDVIVARHERRQGPGRAFATGFDLIASLLEDDDYVLTLEADNTSRLEILDLMLMRSREGHDAIFASPYMYGGGIVGATGSSAWSSLF
jgi:glycosyltransferase involved in cell wall biosynthesis